MNVLTGKEFDEELIPHQLGLAKNQLGKLVRGLPVQISYGQMGSGMGDVVMMLNPHNSKKILQAYKKGSGVRIALHPHEIQHSISHGRGFFDVVRKGKKMVGNAVDKALENPIVRTVAKKGARYSADIVGTAVGAYFGNPMAGAMVGDALGSAAENAIENRSVKAGAKQLAGNAKHKGKEIAMEALEDQVERLPAKYRPIAEEVIHSVGNKKYSSYGQGVKRGRGRPRKGGDVIEDLKNVGMTAKKILGNGMSGRPAKGSPEMKAYMAKIRGMKKGKGAFDFLDPNKNGVAQAFAPDKVVGGLKTGAHYIIPATTSALGGIAGTTAGGPVGGVLGSAAGAYAGDQINKQIGVGVKRGRGRPRKGTGVASSKPFKQALALNKMTFGVTLNNSSGVNEPISKFKTDPRVKPSSTEMTLSPYQNIHSPAMNPFVPKSYQQEGGASCGYGDATPHGGNIYGQGTKKGMSRKTARMAYQGLGLYGGGLY